VQIADQSSAWGSDCPAQQTGGMNLGINRKTIDRVLVFPEPPQHGRSGRTSTGS
jgi:hypothetical protein